MDVGGDDRTLRRIAAVLVALAVLAERAAGRSFLVRWLLLGLLRHAESVARGYVLDVTQWEWPGLEDDLEPGSGPLDAALLGLRLRLLAAVLGALIEQACARHGWTPGLDGSLHRRVPLARPRPAVAACGVFRPYDTS